MVADFYNKKQNPLSQSKMEDPIIESISNSEESLNGDIEVLMFAIGKEFAAECFDAWCDRNAKDIIAEQISGRKKVSSKKTATKKVDIEM